MFWALTCAPSIESVKECALEIPVRRLCHVVSLSVSSVEEVFPALWAFLTFTLVCHLTLVGLTRTSIGFEDYVSTISHEDFK
jgi:hypothetical protein